MKENFDANKIWGWVAEKADAVGEWTAREVPLFIQEYLQWKFIESGVGIAIFVLSCLAFILIGWIIYFFAFRKLSDSIKADGGYAKTSELKASIGIIAPILYLIAATISFFANFPTENIKTCLQIKYAPKVYMVEQAAKFYKDQKK